MFDALDGARVLVPGGAGFVGSALVRQLLEAGSSVTVVDDFFSGSPRNLAGIEGDLRVIEGDVLDRDDLATAFRTAAPTHVFHMVGDTFVPSAYHHPHRFLRINTEGTLNVLQAATSFGIDRMLYVSSTEVYGITGSAPITESQPLAPVNTYAVTKQAADRLCHTFHLEHGTPVTVARIFNCYGPRETQPYVIPEIIRQLATGSTVRLGNIAAARDFTYVDDTARGLMALITSSLPDGEATNVGSGVEVSLTEIVEICARLMGHGVGEIERDTARDRRADIDVFRADASRLTAATGWRPSVGLEEGLERTVMWFRDNGSRWLWEEWCPDGVIRDPRGEPVRR